MQTIIAVAMPHLLELLGLALTGIIGWAASKARQKWGIEIEARHREALLTALLNGARLASARKLTGADAVEAILSHARISVPDAIGVLKPADGVLKSLAKAKLEQVVAEKEAGAAGDLLAEALRRAGAA